MTLTDTLDRRLRDELMDAPDLSPAETERALADLDRVNACLFGHGAGRRTLLGSIREGDRHQTVIDLGTGSGGVAARLAQRASRQRLHLCVIGVDRKLSHLAFGRRARHPQLRVVADADTLPFRTGSCDWTFSNLFFHHFTATRNRAVLAEMRRVARRGAVVVDLRRSCMARILIRILLPLLGVGRVARYDGKLSTDQAWSLEEVRRLTADLPVRELRRRFPFRFSLVLGGAGARRP